MLGEGVSLRGISIAMVRLMDLIIFIKTQEFIYFSNSGVPQENLALCSVSVYITNNTKSLRSHQLCTT